MPLRIYFDNKLIADSKKIQKKGLIIFCFSKIVIPLHTLSKKREFGEMAEWSIAAVLKTVEVRASGGSNPSLSAQSVYYG